MPMHPRVRTTALRRAPAGRQIALLPLLPLLALVVAGAMALAGASETLATALQRQCCRAGASGRSVSLRGSGRTPAGWPCAAGGIVAPAGPAVDPGHYPATAHAPCVAPRFAWNPTARPPEAAIAARPVRPAASPGLPAPSSRAPPVA